MKNLTYTHLALLLLPAFIVTLSMAIINSNRPYEVFHPFEQSRASSWGGDFTGSCALEANTEYRIRRDFQGTDIFTKDGRKICAATLIVRR